MKTLALLIGLCTVGSELDKKDTPSAFEKVSRTILKEPNYVAQPKYALFLFDTKAKFRVWAILDKSKPDLDYYDVLYLDKNANSDLTDAGESFTGTYNPKRAASGVGGGVRDDFQEQHDGVRQDFDRPLTGRVCGVAEVDVSVRGLGIATGLFRSK